MIKNNHPDRPLGQSRKQKNGHSPIIGPMRGRCIMPIIGALLLLGIGIFAMSHHTPARVRAAGSPSHLCSLQGNIDPDCIFTIVEFTKPEDGFHSQPTISGSGERVAFWSTGNLASDLRNEDGSIEIFTHKSGGEIIQVTESKGSILGGFNLAPSINQDGTRIAFFSDRDLDDFEPEKNQDGNFEIFVAEVIISPTATITIRQVTDSEKGVNIAPAISGDGQSVAFVSDRDYETGDNTDGNMEIFLVDLTDWGATNEFPITQLTDKQGGIHDQPTINHDGTRIAYVYNYAGAQEIFLHDLKIGDAILVASSDNNVVNSHPSINGDGTYVVFVSDGDLNNTFPLTITNVDGNPEIFQAYIGLNTMQVGKIWQITNSDSGVVNGTPNINPNASITTSSLIVFTSNGNYAANNEEGNTESFLYNSTDNTFNQLTDTSGSGSSYPTISDDGESMAFAAEGAIEKNTCVRVDIYPHKSASSEHVAAGDWLTYTIEVFNDGPSTASGVQLFDTLSTTYMISSTLRAEPDQSCTTLMPADIECTLGQLKNRASTKVTITFQISPTFQGTFTNTAKVVNEVDENKNDEKNNTSNIVTVTVSEQSDLQIRKVSHPDLMTVKEGGYLTYTLTVTNLGPSELTQPFMVTDTLPQALSLTLPSEVQLITPAFDVVSCDKTPTDDTNAEHPSVTATCTFAPPLAVNDSRTVTIVVPMKVTRSMIIENAAVVASITIDPHADNNRGKATTHVGIWSDLAIRKYTAPLPPVPGAPITYTLVVSNYGPSPAVGAIVSDIVSSAI